MKNILLLFFVSLLPKLLFLFLGYGPEEDAWGHVLNIFEMQESGAYIMSRLPGHPVYEGLLYFLWPYHSPLVYNLVSALAGSLAVVAFYKVAYTHLKENAFILSLAFAFVPVFFLSTTYTIDYPLGLSFALWSMVLLQQKNYWFSAVLLALAVGTRMTWVLFYIPMVYSLLKDSELPQKVWLAFKFTAVAGVLALLCYTPLFYTYGFNFIDTYQLPTPPLFKAIYKGTFGVWGVLGFLAILAFSTLAFWQRLKTKSRLKSHESGWLFLVLIYLAIFVKLPEKSAFFIPIIPFILLLIGTAISRKQTLFLTSFLVVSGFVFGINISDPNRGVNPPKLALEKTVNGQAIYFAPLQGLYESEYQKRQTKNRFAQSVLDQLKLDQKSVVICGWWYAILEIKNLDQNKIPPHVELVYYLPIDQMKTYLDRGYKIYYLPEQQVINDRKYQSTFTVQNASPFNIK